MKKHLSQVLSPPFFTNFLFENNSHLKICIAALALLIQTICWSQEDGENLGYVTFKDSTTVFGALKIKGLKKGIIKITPHGQLTPLIFSSDTISSFGIQNRYHYFSKLSEQGEYVFWKELVKGSSSLYAAFEEKKTYYTEGADGTATQIPKKRAERKLLYDRLLEENPPIVKNAMLYKQNEPHLRRLVKFINHKEKKRFPLTSIRGEFNYLRKKLTLSGLDRVEHAIFAQESNRHLFLLKASGYESNSLGGSIVIELPMFDYNNTFFVTRLGYLQDDFQYFERGDGLIYDASLRTSYLNGEIAIKVMRTRGNFFPYLKIGGGGYLKTQDSSNVLLIIQSSSGSELHFLDTELLSNIQLYPAIRIGVEYPLINRFLVALELGYNKELSFSNDVKNSIDAFGVSLSINIL